MILLQKASATPGLKTRGTNKIIEEIEVDRRVCEGFGTSRYSNHSECLLLTLSSDLTPEQYKNAHQNPYNCTVLQYSSE